MKIKTKNIYLGYLSYLNMTGKIGKAESNIEILIKTDTNTYRLLEDDQLFNLENNNFLVNSNTTYRIDNIHCIEEILNCIMNYDLKEERILEIKESLKLSYWIRYGELYDAHNKQMSLLKREIRIF